MITNLPPEPSSYAHVAASWLVIGLIVGGISGMIAMLLVVLRDDERVPRRRVRTVRELTVGTPSDPIHRAAQFTAGDEPSPIQHEAMWAAIDDALWAQRRYPRPRIES